MNFFENNNEDIHSIVKKFEHMINSNKSIYLDIYQFEEIIDFYIETDKLNKAFVAAKIANKVHPSSTNLKLKKAQLLIELGKVEKALSILDYLEKIENSNVEIYFFKGLALLKSHNNKEAEKYFEKAFNLSEDEEIEDMLQIVSQYYQKNMDYKLAIKYLKRLNELDPYNIDAIYDIAMCYLEIFNYKKSEKYFNKYLDFDAFSKTAWLYLGDTLKNQNKIVEAIIAYEYSIAIDPNFIFAYINKANVLADNKNIEKAIETYKDCLNYNPKNTKIHTYIGELYEEIKKYNSAIKYYKKALDIDKNSAEAWFGIGIINYYQNNLFESLFFIKRAIQIDENNAEFFFYLGKLNEKLGFYTDSIQAYLTSNKILPNQDETKIALANIYTKNNETNKSLEILNKINETSNYYSDSLYIKSANLFIENNTKESLKILDSALNLDFSLNKKYINLFESNTFIKKYIEKYKNKKSQYNE